MTYVFRPLSLRARAPGCLLDHQVIPRRQGVPHEGPVFSAQRGWQPHRGQAANQRQV